MRAQLNKLINEIVPYLMNHNAEAEACDLMMEVEKLEELAKFVDEAAFSRVCLYLKRFEYFQSLPFTLKAYQDLVLTYTVIFFSAVFRTCPNLKTLT